MHKRNFGDIFNETLILFQGNEMNRFILILIICSFVFLFPTHTYSLHEVNMSTSSMVKNATEIIVAKCISSEARFDENTGFVFTYTTFEVDQTVKNEIDTDKIEIRMIGGQVGNLRTDVQGLPRFSEQDEMVLFLGKKNRHGYHSLLSVLKGMYKVEIDEFSGEKRIKNPPSDLNLTNANSRQVFTGSSIPLDDFISNIKESL